MGGSQAQCPWDGSASPWVVLFSSSGGALAVPWVTVAEVWLSSSLLFALVCLPSLALCPSRGGLAWVPHC